MAEYMILLKQERMRFIVLDGFCTFYPGKTYKYLI